MYIEYHINNYQSNLMLRLEHSVSGDKSVNSAEAKCVGLYLIAMPRTAKFIDKVSVLIPKKKKKWWRTMIKVNIMIDKISLSSKINYRNGSQ